MDEDITVYVATERHDATFDAHAVHPNGHILSLGGQGHIPVACDCPSPP